MPGVNDSTVSDCGMWMLFIYLFRGRTIIHKLYFYNFLKPFQIVEHQDRSEHCHIRRRRGPQG